MRESRPDSLPSVAVVVVHWRRPEWCYATVASLLASAEIRVTCIIVDNESSLGGVLDELHDERLTIVSTAENLGYTGGANLGLSYALEPGDSDFVSCASHDVIVEPHTLRTLTDALRDDPNLGIVGPVLGGGGTSAGGGWRGWRATYRKQPASDRRTVRCEWLSGTLMLLRPECVLEVGGFDERLGSYVEDVDLGLRANDSGWGVAAVGAARATQNGSGSNLVTRLVDINSALLVAKRAGPWTVLPLLLRYAFWVPRGLLSAILPGRDRERRVAAVRHSADHARSIVTILRRWNDVLDASRDPDRYTPRFGPVSDQTPSSPTS